MKVEDSSNSDIDSYIFDKGRYLFADYTPFDENKNFLNMLKDFVSLSNNIIQVHKDSEELHDILRNAELLHNEMVAKIEQFKNSATVTMDTFHKKYNNITDAQLKPTGTDLFLRARNSLINLLTNTQEEYSKRFGKYKYYLQLTITNSYRNAINLLQIWLLKDYYNLPYTIRSKSLNVIDASIDNSDDKNYRIVSTNTIILGRIDNNTSSLSYTFIINSSDLDFWNYKRKVSDLGLKDILIPVGLKTSISEKLKKSFRFVSGKTKESDEKEPEFVTADGYYIISSRLESNRTLSITLAENPSKIDDNVIKIDYGFADLYHTNGEINTNSSFEGKIPRINYILKEEGVRSDVLQIKEIIEYTDVSKIMHLGRAIADKMRILLNPYIVTSRSVLQDIKVDDKSAVFNDPIPIYNEELVISFLESVAWGFVPLIRKLKEKSTIKGELILKHEVDGGERKEYVVRIEELNSQLSSTDAGKRIANILGIFGNISNTGTSVTA